MDVLLHFCRTVMKDLTNCAYIYYQRFQLLIIYIRSPFEHPLLSNRVSITKSLYAVMMSVSLEALSSVVIIVPLLFNTSLGSEDGGSYLKICAIYLSLNLYFHLTVHDVILPTKNNSRVTGS